MGNRAVITTKEQWQRGGIGIYVHWHGGRDSVEAFLKYCKMRGFRTDDYGLARLTQVIGNYFGGGLSIGIDTLWHLDCNNGDNGVYIIDGWDIANRVYFDGQEQDAYGLTDMLIDIDKAQPESERLGEDFIKAPETSVLDIRTGDKVYMQNYNGEISVATVQGFGMDIINGTDVTNVPFVDLYGEDYRNNINNYLRDDYYRIKQ